MWPDLCAVILDRCFSDHCHILLKNSDKNFGSIPFRLYDWWLQCDSLNDLVRTSWEQRGIRGSNAVIFKEKLKRLKNEIKAWKLTLSDVGSVQLKVLQEKMNVWDKKAEVTELSTAENEEFSAACFRYFKAATEHALVLKQRSQIKWAVEGDENTAFYHGIVKGRMKRMGNGWRILLELKKRFMVSLRDISVNLKRRDLPSQVQNLGS